MRRGSADVKDILKNYGRKFSNQIDGFESMTPTDEAFSREYDMFRNEAMGNRVTTYEKLAQWAGNLINIQIKPQDREEVQMAIDTAHINVTPDDAASLGAVTTIAIGLAGAGLSFYQASQLEAANTEANRAAAEEFKRLKKQAGVNVMDELSLNTEVFE